MAAKIFTIGGNSLSYGGYRLRDTGSGSLTISKTVNGSGFDPSKTFELTATFRRPITYNGVTSATHTFNLAHGQSVTITDIPELTSYTVTESPLSQQDIDDGYSFIGMTGGSGTIPNGPIQAVATNGYAGLPARTLRLLYPDGVTPTFTYGTATQVSSSPNVWDLHYDSTSWGILLQDQPLLQVLKVGDTGGITNFESMFKGCTNLTSVPWFDTSDSTTARTMFDGCANLTSVPLFDTSGCHSMQAMFRDCESLTSVPLFDTSACTDMQYMFTGCSNLVSVPLFDTGACTSMRYMFSGCRSLTSVPLLDTSACTDMQYMFANCTSLTSVPLFNTSACTNMLRMFYNCLSLTAVPLLDTRVCTNMKSMFASCDYVQSGALALYIQASTQATPPANHDGAFSYCGSRTATGAAELAQIPASWGGTGA